LVGSPSTVPECPECVAGVVVRGGDVAVVEVLEVADAGALVGVPRGVDEDVALLEPVVAGCAVPHAAMPTAHTTTEVAISSVRKTLTLTPATLPRPCRPPPFSCYGQ
jgi:hypothetical protein